MPKASTLLTHFESDFVNLCSWKYGDMGRITSPLVWGLKIWSIMKHPDSEELKVNWHEILYNRNVSIQSYECLSYNVWMPLWRHGLNPIFVEQWTVKNDSKTLVWTRIFVSVFVGSKTRYYRKIQYLALSIPILWDFDVFDNIELITSKILI